MPFTWTGLAAPDSPLSDDELTALGLGTDFDSQPEAEAWLSSAYLDLSDAGVASVSLFQDGNLVYGPMSLEEM
ncbi:hypothetical protein [Propionibacterium sp.]|uniref:hypothetical protein n=1 Tax=Propionibacterium sp. TaxID=1977903 RepID=UPI0039ECEB62